MSTVSRVIKNSSFLYLKMGITVLLSLYTTRLILGTLGASDFGIFNIVGGAIAMLGFLNSTMSNATLRFMAYSEGERILGNKRKVFNVSLVFHFVIAFITLLLLLAVMHPLFRDVLNIQSDRVFAAKIVYYSFMFSTILTIINVPYDAVMNAHENMLYYSLIGILEAFLKLLIAFLCIYTKYDKLIVYGLLMAILPLITLTIMKVYCHRYYGECVISLRKYWDIKIVKQIITFSVWNFLTALSSLLSAQGIGLILNHFFGTVLNAAQGIANQLNGQLSAFSGNMMKALNPVIIKSAGAKNLVAMNTSTIAGCKYSTYLILLFAIPFMIEIQFILDLWLKDVPKWTSVFCVLLLIQTLICQMCGGVATAVYAQGDIKKYAIYKSVMNILPLFVVFICFYLGGEPYFLYIPMIVIWAIGGNIVILIYAKKKCNLSIKEYLKGVFLPVLFVALIMYLCGYIVNQSFSVGWGRLILCCCSTTVAMICSLILFGMTTIEKKQVKCIIENFVRSRNIKVKVLEDEDTLDN